MYDNVYLGKMLINLDMSEIWDDAVKVNRFFDINPDLHEWLRANIISFCDDRVYPITETYRTYAEISFHLSLSSSDAILWRLRPDGMVAVALEL